MSTPRVGRAEVEAVLTEALDLAKRQGALLWELRASLTAARARVARGKHQEAKALVEHVYSRFTEGFDSNDLRAAARALQTM